MVNRFLPKVIALFLVAGLQLLWSVSLFSQTPVLLKNPSDDCNLSIDGADVGKIAADQTRKFPMIEGEHSVVCVSTDWYTSVDGSERSQAKLSMTYHVSGAEQRLVMLPFLTIPATIPAERHGAYMDVSADPDARLFNTYDCADLHESLAGASLLWIQSGGTRTTCGSTAVIRVSWKAADGESHFALVPPGSVGLGGQRRVRLR